MCSALGISTGSVGHTLMAAFGLSAILATSSTAFLLVKTAGALYLIYLGASMLFKHTKEPSGGPKNKSRENGLPRSEPGESLWKIYRQGIVTNVLNPKVALFFLSFLPQFVDVGAEVQFLPFLILGVAFVTTGTLWCLLIAWMAGTLVQCLSGNGPSISWLNKMGATLFIGLGVKLLAEPS